MKYLFTIVVSTLLFMLHACTVESYTISFDSQGGSNVEPFSTSFSINKDLPIPEKEGFIFLGWSLTPSGDVIVSLKDLAPSDYLLYAIWDQLDVTYTLRWIVDDEIVDEKMLNVGEAITPIEAPEKEGYTFSGWYLDQSLLTHLDLTVMPNSNLNIYGKFTLYDMNIWSFETIEHSETTLKIVLRISGIVEFIGFNATLTFDETLLTLTKVESLLPVVLNQGTSSVKFNYVNALNKTTVSTNILELTFTKLSNQEPSIDLEVIEMITIDSLYNISNIDFSIIPFSED
jgi:uncharacterized repeat protein (TIGR02543 family)